MENKKDFVVLSISLANWLLKANMKLNKIVKHKEDENKIVFMFEDTPELRQLIEIYSNRTKE